MKYNASLVGLIMVAIYKDEKDNGGNDLTKNDWV